jgi:hypothetical protein
MKPTTLAVALAALLLAAPADGATIVGTTGVGPLKIGMSRTAALATGWLSNRHNGCELAGPPLPIDYDLDGAKAPAGLEGSVEFTGGRLSNIALSKGVRTTTGVVPGKTTWPSMVKRYRNAGYRVSARYESTFGGTFVNVKRKDGGEGPLLSGFAMRGKPVSVIGLPYVPVCE